MKSEPPKIAYLTLAYQPINVRHAIWNATEQSYPHRLKTLYLIHQEPYPEPMKNLSAVPFKVRELFVPGKWPALWFLKLKKFCDYVEEPVTLLWDEDDRFEYQYTSKVVGSLIDTPSDVTWNWDNEFVTKDGIFRKKHHEPIGTLGIYSNILKQVIHRVGRQYPNHQQGDGPLDTAVRKYLQEHFRIMEHSGVRGFFMHLKSSTRRKNKWEIDR